MLNFASPFLIQKSEDRVDRATPWIRINFLVPHHVCEVVNRGALHFRDNAQGLDCTASKVR